MMQIMLQTENMLLLAPQTMYYKQFPTASPDTTLPCLIFSSVAELLHALTLSKGLPNTRMHTLASTLPLPCRVAVFMRLPSHLLQVSIHQD